MVILEERVRHTFMLQILHTAAVFLSIRVGHSLQRLLGWYWLLVHVEEELQAFQSSSVHFHIWLQNSWVFEDEPVCNRL